MDVARLTAIDIRTTAVRNSFSPNRLIKLIMTTGKTTYVRKQITNVVMIQSSRRLPAVERNLMTEKISMT